MIKEALDGLGLFVVSLLCAVRNRWEIKSPLSMQMSCSLSYVVTACNSNFSEAQAKWSSVSVLVFSSGTSGFGSKFPEGHRFQRFQHVWIISQFAYSFHVQNLSIHQVANQIWGHPLHLAKRSSPRRKSRLELHSPAPNDVKLVPSGPGWSRYDWKNEGTAGHVNSYPPRSFKLFDFYSWQKKIQRLQSQSQRSARFPETPGRRHPKKTATPGLHRIRGGLPCQTMASRRFTNPVLPFRRRTWASLTKPWSKWWANSKAPNRHIQNHSIASKFWSELDPEIWENWPKSRLPTHGSFDCWIQAREEPQVAEFSDSISCWDVLRNFDSFKSQFLAASFLSNVGLRSVLFLVCRRRTGLATSQFHQKPSCNIQNKNGLLL